MFIKNFILAKRLFFKYPLNSFITVFGLSTGLTCFLALGLYVYDEYQTDRFHTRYDHIFKVSMKHVIDGKEMFEFPPPAGLKKDLDEMAAIEASTRVYKSGKVVVQAGDKVFFENYGLYVDEEWKDIFDFRYRGSSYRFLSNPDLVAISTELAFRYFADEDPLGKSIMIDGNSYIVDNIILPSKRSSLTVDFIISYQKQRSMGVDIDSYKVGHTPYFVVTRHMTKEQLAASLQKIISQNLGEGQVLVTVTAFRDFYYDDSYFNRSHLLRADRKYSVIFIVIGIFILLASIINYINLITSRGSERAKEVGVKKTIGATGGQLTGQFMFESFLTTLVSALLAIGLLEWVIPYFNQLLVRPIDTEILSSVEFVLFYIFLIITIAILAGSYPAFLMSTYKPAVVLKGQRAGNKGSFLIRKLLTSIQFVVTTLLIMGTITISRQVSYMLDYDLGFDTEKLLTIHTPPDFPHGFSAFKNTLLSLDFVESVSVANLPGINFMFGRETDHGGVTIGLLLVDHDFLSTAGIKLIEGRDFRPQDQDSSFILINKSLRDLQFGKQETSFGKLSDSDNFLIGVVEDFQFFSAKSSVIPAEIKLHKGSFEKVLIRLNTFDSPTRMLDRLRAVYDRHIQDYPMEYSFVDEAYDDKFRSEILFSRLVHFFMWLSVLIGAFGLFGLAQFTLNKKIKEFGVRKILGAKGIHIGLEMTRGLMMPFLLSVVIGFPLGHFVFSNWLERFSNRIQIDAHIYLPVLVFIAGIALFTIVYQLFSAIRVNPVDVLKEE